MGEKRKMTEEEKELVVNNMKLVYFFMHKHNLPIDEWEDVLFEKACKAAMAYDKNKSEFSTYLIFVLGMEVKHLFRKSHAKKRGHGDIPLSFNDIIVDAGNEHKVERGEIIEDRENNIRNLITQTAFKQALNLLSEVEKKIILMATDGKSQEEIAESVNLSQPQVSRVLRKIRREFRKNGL